VVLAVDPGSAKCGLAVVDEARRVRARRVVATPDLAASVERLLAEHPVTHVIVGDRTGSKHARGVLAGICGGRPVLPADEHLTSEEARRRYFRENPPRGLGRLIPSGFRLPPCPIDDYVAVILAERYLS